MWRYHIWKRKCKWSLASWSDHCNNYEEEPLSSFYDEWWSFRIALIWKKCDILIEFIRDILTIIFKIVFDKLPLLRVLVYLGGWLQCSHIICFYCRPYKEGRLIELKDQRESTSTWIREGHGVECNGFAMAWMQCIARASCAAWYIQLHFLRVLENPSGIPRFHT